MLLDSPHPGGRVNSQSSKSLSWVPGVGSLGTRGFCNHAVEKPQQHGVGLLPPQREPGLYQLVPRCPLRKPSSADPTLLLPWLTPRPLST